MNPDVPAQKGQALSVLVAEDSKENQILFRDYLGSDGYSLEFADNGREALEKYKDGSYDIILMDLQMPEMDGYTATKLIRAWEIAQGKQNTPIIAVSAHDLGDGIMDAGFSSYLVKPVSAADLKRTIGDLSSVDAGPVAGPVSSQSSIKAAFDARMADLVPGYLSNRRKELLELKRMLETSEFEGIERIGHKLKGNALSYGFPNLGLLGSALEAAANAKDPAKSRELISEIETFLKTAG